MQISPETIELAIGILGGILTAVVTAWAKAKFDQRAANRKAKERDVEISEAMAPSNLLEARFELLRLTFELRDRSKATRALILKASNSGRFPVVGEAWHGKVVEEAKDLDLPSVKNTFKAADLDPSYLLLLQRVLQDKVVHIHTEDMPDGMLKDIYSMTQVHDSTVILLHQEDGAIFYVSLTYSKGRDDALVNDEERQRQVLLICEKIAAVFRVHRDVRVSQRRGEAL